jgi:hypothetical protein
MSKPIEWNAVLVKRMFEQIQGLAYGSINITVHGGQIVQIERTERQRHDSPSGKERRQQGGYR